MKNDIIISFAMSNYLLYGGGTNLATLNYQLMYNKNDISYLCLAPYLFHGKKMGIFNNMWVIIVDGEEKGVCNTRKVIKILEEIVKKGAHFHEIHVHHWQFTNINAFCEIVDMLSCPIKMFIHDYSTLCCNYTLLDNELKYCGNGGVNYDKCYACKHYPESREKVNQYISIWHRYEKRIEFIFPSAVARDVWISAYSKYASKTRIIPHQKFVGYYIGGMRKKFNKIRVAYIASRAYYKGWNSFESLYEKNMQSDYLEWYYLGVDMPQKEKIKTIFVDNKSNPNAMIDALRDNRIDIVILWSICKETYSYTYYECLASNAFVLTNLNSGNIAAQVLERKNGIVLNSEEELFDIFKTNQIQGYLEEYKSKGVLGPEKLICNDELLIKCSSPGNKIFKMPFICKSGVLGTMLLIFDFFVYIIKRRLNG